MNYVERTIEILYDQIQKYTEVIEILEKLIQKKKPVIRDIYDLKGLMCPRCNRGPYDYGHESYTTGIEGAVKHLREDRWSFSRNQTTLKIYHCGTCGPKS